VTLHIGTSGWAYPEWKPDFYPRDVTRSAFLSFYAGRLSACEINATFYKTQEREVIGRWALDVPEGFRFAIKAHRALTHGKSIAPDGFRAERLASFLETVSWFGPRRGPVLFQLPPYRKVDLDALSALLGKLPDALPVAFEFRDRSWDDPTVRRTILDAGGTICLADVGGGVPSELPAGRFAYVRMRAERYSRNKRAGWRKLLEREAATRDVYVFTKHEGVAAGDPFGGVGLAVWLRRYARAQPTVNGEGSRSSSNQTDVA
jgi:uncharacterized protein YecE (DUF72 family)